MNNQTEAVEKQEAAAPEGVERTQSGKTFLPRVDIVENNDAILLRSDMPGVDENSVDITLENNILDIRGSVGEESFEGQSLAYREYETGDYHRSFSISDEIDKEKIEATVKNGVLHLTLPKAVPTKKKIAVKAA